MEISEEIFTAIIFILYIYHPINQCGRTSSDIQLNYKSIMISSNDVYDFFLGDNEFHGSLSALHLSEDVLPSHEASNNQILLPIPELSLDDISPLLGPAIMNNGEVD